MSVEEFMFQNVAYRPTVYITGTLCSKNVLTKVGGWFKKASKHPYVIQKWPLINILWILTDLLA